MEPLGSSDELHLREYAAVLWRRRLIVLGVLVPLVVASLAWSLLQAPAYRSTAEILLANSLGETIFNPDSSDARSTSAARSRVHTEIEVMKSRSVRDAVAKELGFVPKVSITERGETDVVAIAATRRRPADASRIAQTYAEVFVETRRKQRIDELLAASEQVQTQVDQIRKQITDLQAPILALDAQIVARPPGAAQDSLRDQRQQLATSVSQQVAGLQSRLDSYNGQLDQLRLAANITRTGGAQIVSAAVPNDSPVNRKPVRTTAIAFLLGTVFGVTLAFLRERLDDRVKGRNDLEPLLGELPVLALVPPVPGWREVESAELISVTHPSSVCAEAYRVMRTAISFLALDRPVDILHVTSASSGEGKTTTVANLAISFSQLGRRVVVVDCDLRRPRTHEFFGLRNEVGLSDVIIGDVSLAQAVQRVPGKARLAVLTAGQPTPNPAELLAFHRTHDILRRARGRGRRRADRQPAGSAGNGRHYPGGVGRTRPSCSRERVDPSAASSSAPSRCCARSKPP